MSFTGIEDGRPITLLTIPYSLEATPSHRVTFSGTGATVKLSTESFSSFGRISFQHTWTLQVAPDVSGPIGTVRIERPSAVFGFPPSVETRDVLITPVPDPPSALKLTSNTVAENAAGAFVGTIGVVDPDGPGPFTAELISDPSGLFEIRGTDLFLKPGAAADFEKASKHALVIRVKGLEDGLSRDFTQTIAVRDVAETATTPDGLTVSGSVSADRLTGGSGNDILLGNAGNDTLIAGAGADTLDGGAGADSMVGGQGDDVYIVAVAGDVVVELAGEGVDSVRAFVNYTLAANVERLELARSNLIGQGSGLDNTIIGAAGNETLRGMGGDDSLEGGLGNDRLDGGIGVDRMQGGAGDDTYVVDNPGDVVIENAGEGSDLVEASISFALPDHVEKLTLAAAAGGTGTGNDLANVLRGTASNDRLLGLGGSDTMLGGAGNDELDGGAGDDSLTGSAGRDTLTGGAGRDTFSFLSHTDSPVAAPDLITDFTRGEDRISLAAIDAIPGTVGDNAFVFLPGMGAPFTTGPQVRWLHSGGETIIQAEWGRVAGVDMEIRLSGLVNLTATDFVL